MCDRALTNWCEILAGCITCVLKLDKSRKLQPEHAIESCSEVFLATPTPVIHSGPYHFHFDADSLNLGRNTCLAELLQFDVPGLRGFVE